MKRFTITARADYSAFTIPDVPALDRVGHLCASAGCWEILTLDGRVVCWENVLVLRLPVDRHGTGTPARGRRAKPSE